MSDTVTASAAAGGEPVLLVAGLLGTLLDAVGNLAVVLLSIDDPAVHGAVVIVVNAAIAFGTAMLARRMVDSPTTVNRKVLDGIALGNAQTCQALDFLAATPTVRLDPVTVAEAVISAAPRLSESTVAAIADAVAELAA